MWVLILHTNLRKGFHMGNDRVNTLSTTCFIKSDTNNNVLSAALDAMFNYSQYAM